MGSKKHKDKRDSRKHKKRRSRSRERERDSHKRHKSVSSKKDKEKRSPEFSSPCYEVPNYEDSKHISEDSASSRNLQEIQESDTIGKSTIDLSDDEFDIDKLLESKLLEKSDFSNRKVSKRQREEDKEESRKRLHEDLEQLRARQNFEFKTDYPGRSFSSQGTNIAESSSWKQELTDSPPTYKNEHIPFISDVEVKKEPEEPEEFEDRQEPQLSLSIEETNKLRAKLGLKPLEVGNEFSGAGDNNTENESAKPKEIFVKTENIREIKKSETLREKLKVMKEKRAIEERLKRMRGIADSDSEDESAVDWVLKHQKLMEEKQKAEKQAKILEEMDKEFGVGALVEEQQQKAKAYTSQHLRGLTVQHDVAAFAEGQQVILTLRDKGVLEEEEDVLENVNIVENERYARNVENKKKKPDYVAYDEPEYDEFGILQKKNLLSKYDEEIEGEKKKTFKIGTNITSTCGTREQELELIRMKLKQQNKVTLEMPELKLANEYYTADDMVKFKKPKKKKKVLKSILKADDLLAGSVTQAGRDLGSRKRRRLDDDDTPVISEESDMLPIIDEDQTDTELHSALNKAKKLKERKVMSTAPEKVLEILSKTTGSTSSSSTDVKDGNIELNSVAEFCRTLGDIPTYGLSGNRDEEVEDLMEYEKELEESQKQELDPQNRGTWNEVDIDEKPAEISVRENEPILEEEPDISSGVAGALKLAMKKGYLDKEAKKLANASKASHLQAQSYTIEEKFYEDDKFGKRDRYTGPVQEFREKSNYKPDVKLEYIDDSGRLLTAKEAFRYLSHKFHGKGPGKNKVDKRMKKLEQDTRLKQMSSTDTPLNTVKLLQAKQKETQSPYIVLSGGNKTLTQTMISKTKL